MKIVPLKQLSDRDLVRLHYEVDILKSISHQNVPKLLDTFTDAQNAYLVMELAKGLDLYEAINKHQFMEREACKVTRQLLSVAQYCHTRQIVHRDLKPENIVIDE